MRLAGPVRSQPRWQAFDVNQLLRISANENNNAPQAGLDRAASVLITQPRCDEGRKGPSKRGRQRLAAWRRSIAVTTHNDRAGRESGQTFRGRTAGLKRADWYDIARDTNWTPSYVSLDEFYPPEMSDTIGVEPEKWESYDEPYKTTYREYV